MAEKGNGSIFQEVAKKADIVRVVSAYLGNQALVPSGNHFLAVCPFHHDTHPSMVVDPTWHNYHCWACGAKGSAIDFVVQYAKLKPIDALKKVCEICSIPLPADFSQHSFVPEVEKQYPDELKALSDLAAFYETILTLPIGEAGRKYLEGRKIPEEVQKEFQIGFAPKDTRMAVSALRTKFGYSVETLEKAGILSSASSSFEDRFSERVMFPIKDRFGHVVGFSGRVLSKEQSPAKYINYPETALFRKSEILYHFDVAREEARKAGFLYLCEGFMDVIAYVRAGIGAVAGTMGVALSESHLSLLKSLGVEVRLALDADEPGQIGIEKAAKLLLSKGIPFRVLRRFRVSRPDPATGKEKLCKDADEVVTYCGKDALREEASRLYSGYLFLLGRRLKGRKRLEDPMEVKAFLLEARPFYRALDQLSKDEALEITSRITPFSKDVLLSLLTQDSDTLPQQVDRGFRGKGNGRRDTFTPRRYRNGTLEDFRPDVNAIQNIQATDARGNILYVQRDLLRQMKASPFAEGLPEDLLQNELWLAGMLPLSREATLSYYEGQHTFLFAPFASFLRLLAAYYSFRGDDCPGLSKDDFETLKKALTPEEEKSEENAGPFDLTGIEEDESAFPAPEIDPKEKSFLLGFLPVLEAQSGKSDFDMNSLKRLSALESLYQERERLSLEFDRKEGARENWTREERDRLSENREKILKAKCGIF